MTLFEDYVLPRASRYGGAKNPNDMLPIPWGDLTEGGSLGVWRCPCINQVDSVFAIAGCAILSESNGNVITVYRDGVEVTSGYVITASGNYENQGVIAYITFTAEETGEISVRCKGRVPSGTLIENPIEIVEDFLTNLVGLASADLDTTSLNRAKFFCSQKGYRAAGLLNKDQSPEKTVKEILNDYLARAYFVPGGEYAFGIEDEQSPYDIQGFIPAHRLDKAQAIQKLASLVNQIEAEYAYNYVESEYQEHDNGVTTSELISQGTYGVRKTIKKFKWCRNQATMNEIQRMLISQSAYPVWQVEFWENTIKHIALEERDYVCITVPFLYDTKGEVYDNQIFKIIGTAKDIDSQKIKFTCLDTGKFWHVAGNIYLSVAAGLYLSVAGALKLGGARDTNVYEI